MSTTTKTEKKTITHSQLLFKIQEGSSKKELCEFFGISASVLKEGLEKFNIDPATIKAKNYIFIDDVNQNAVTYVQTSVKSDTDSLIDVELAKEEPIATQTLVEVEDESFESDVLSVFDK